MSLDTNWLKKFKMNKEINNILSLFADEEEFNIDSHETWDEFECKSTLTLKKSPQMKDLIGVLPHISNRDSWRFTIESEYSQDIFDINSKSGCLENKAIEEELEPYLNDQIFIIYKVSKHLRDNTLTVYEESLFTEHLQNSKLLVFLNVVNKRFGNGLNIEVWTEAFSAFCSRTIHFIPKGEQAQANNIEVRQSRNNLQKNYCQSDGFNFVILPEDLLMNTTSNVISLLFRKACVVLSMLYVCDSTKIDDDVEFHLCGYKTLRTKLSALKLTDLAIDDVYCEKWYDIYNWAYSGGYTLDRLSISRNIISLNCNANNIVSINESTFRSIKSNFNIFEQDNVRQYIKVRNEVSNMLISMQKEINTIVDGFASDFKKNIIAISTFFLTVIVVRVISKGDFTGGFTTPVMILSLIYLGISFGLLYYSRRELDRKKNLFEKHYDQIKERYRILLSDEELKEMFEDSDPNKFQSHANYIEWQKKVYTKIWLGSIVALTLFVVFVWMMNLINDGSTCKLIQSVIKCCIKSILR